jgi:hypothetical protein
VQPTQPPAQPTQAAQPAKPTTPSKPINPAYSLTPAFNDPFPTAPFIPIDPSTLHFQLSPSESAKINKPQTLEWCNSHHIGHEYPQSLRTEPRTTFCRPNSPSGSSVECEPNRFCTLEHLTFHAGAAFTIGDCTPEPGKMDTGGNIVPTALDVKDVFRVFPRHITLSQLETEVDERWPLTFVMYRDCNPPQNFFHCMNDWFFIWDLFFTFNIEPRDPNVRVLFYDIRAQGRWWPFWFALFREENLVVLDEWKKFEKNIRYVFLLYFFELNVLDLEKVIVPAQTWFMKPFKPLPWVALETDGCPYQSELLASLNFRIREQLFSMLDDDSSLVRTPLIQEWIAAPADGEAEPLRVVFLVREKPPDDRAVMDRMFKDQTAISGAIEQMCSGAKVLTIDFGAGFSVWEQIAVMRSADVFIGAHGSGMSWLHVMRPGTGVVEISTKKFAWNHAYANMARWIGLHFQLFSFC